MIYHTSDLLYISFLTSKLVIAQWPKEQVVSDFNFFSYLRYVSMQNVDKQKRMLKLPVLQHHPRSEPVQIKLKDGKMYTTITTMCEQEDCNRCVQNLGGYRFQYIGPWTCKGTIGFPPPQARRLWMDCKDCLVCHSR